jgi:hypothetical protein
MFKYTGPIKPYKAAQRRLEQQLRRTQAELQALQRRNEFLRVWDSILTALSSDFQGLRDYASAAAAAGQSTLASCVCYHASSEEDQLLQQLQSLSVEPATGAATKPAPRSAHNCSGSSTSASSGSAALPSSAALLARGNSNNSSSSSAVQLLVAPKDDPLYLLRHLCTLKPYPGAAELTAEQLAADYSATVQMLALQLKLYKAEQQVPVPADVATAARTAGGKTPLQKMQDALCRYGCACKLRLVLRHVAEAWLG